MNLVGTYQSRTRAQSKTVRLSGHTCSMNLLPFDPTFGLVIMRELGAGRVNWDLGESAVTTASLFVFLLKPLTKS
jgi:hypothetical protein